MRTGFFAGFSAAYVYFVNKLPDLSDDAACQRLEEMDSEIRDYAAGAKVRVQSSKEPNGRN